MTITSVNEELLAQDYLQSYLDADAELRDLVNGVTYRSAWADLAPPYVKIQRLDGNDLQTIGLFRVWADLTYLIRGIVLNDGQDLPYWGDVKLIANRLDQLLQAHEVVNDEIELHSFREEPYSDETLEGGKLYLHAGGIYRVRCHAV